MPNIANMTVPSRAHPALRWLAGLDETVAQDLVRAVTAGSNFTSSRELVDHVAEVPSVSRTEANALVSVLFNLASLHHSHGWSVVDMAETAAQMTDVGIPSEHAEVFRSRLTELLSASSIVGLAKAVEVAYEFDHLFHTARILTDLRPVFGDEPQQGALGGFITHTLRVDYFDRGQLKTFSLAMGDDELAELETAIERAKQKKAALASLVASAGLVGFEPMRG